MGVVIELNGANARCQLGAAVSKYVMVDTKVNLGEAKKGER